MKKILITTSLVFGLLGLTGCANNSKPTPDFNKCMIDGAKAPNWVCNDGANMEGGIFAVGSAEKSPMGITFQRTEATSAARDALARQIQVKVKNMFKQFQATTGIGKDQTADKATQNVSKQVAQATLEGSKVINRWMSPKGTLFVLVGMPDSKKLQQQVKESVKTSFHNDKALWQKFLAEKADKKLDEAVAKEFGPAN